MKGGALLLYLKITELCNKKKISIRKLETDLGFSFGSVCKWNNNIPSFDKIIQVAAYLGISLDELAKEMQTKERSK
jgi:transcriptional regulator with XRE-family HTH domain